MKLSSDNRTCVGKYRNPEFPTLTLPVLHVFSVTVNEEVLLFSRVNEIRGVDLSMPSYYTIPTITLPQAIVPLQLDFVASSKRIYWADVQGNEVKRRNLTGVKVESIIDTGTVLPQSILEFSKDAFSAFCVVRFTRRRTERRAPNLKLLSGIRLTSRRH